MQPQPIEVEFKFPVPDLAQTRSEVIALGAQVTGKVDQSDEYLNDPVRDFAKQDIALRIRQVDGRYGLTFKGPNLDPTAKIRTEIETDLQDRQTADQIRATFLGIGFFSVAVVAKQREKLTLDWQEFVVQVCLDDVAEVGQFVELELVVDDLQAMPAAKQALQQLAAELKLTDATRTSYLEMLLRNRGQL